jgi:hypothetical protein
MDDIPTVLSGGTLSLRRGEDGGEDGLRRRRRRRQAPKDTDECEGEGGGEGDDEDEDCVAESRRVGTRTQWARQLLQQRVAVHRAGCSFVPPSPGSLPTKGGGRAAAAARGRTNRGDLLVASVRHGWKEANKFRLRQGPRIRTLGTIPIFFRLPERSANGGGHRTWYRVLFVRQIAAQFGKG